VPDMTEGLSSLDRPRRARIYHFEGDFVNPLVNTPRVYPATVVRASGCAGSMTGSRPGVTRGSLPSSITQGHLSC
jgi:hypothetical protein